MYKKNHSRFFVTTFIRSARTIIRRTMHETFECQKWIELFNPGGDRRAEEEVQKVTELQNCQTACRLRPGGRSPPSKNPKSKNPKSKNPRTLLALTRRSTAGGRCTPDSVCPKPLCTVATRGRRAKASDVILTDLLPFYKGGRPASQQGWQQIRPDQT